MKTPRRSTGRGVGFDMTPMIDIVFQLIIFFLVSSHLAKQEAQLKLPLPLAASGEEPIDSDLPRLTVNVERDGSLLLGAGPVSAAELEQRLRAKRQASGDNLEVRVRCDRAVAYQHVEPLLLACTKAEVWNVSFAVIRPEDEQR